MRRRTVLAVTGALPFASLAGCLDSSFGTDETGDDTRLGGNETNGESTESGSADEKAYAYDESRRDPIFLENHTNEEVIVELIVEQKSDGAVLVESAYRVPAGTGLEIPDVANVGEEYEITAEYDGTVEEYDWTVLTCAHEDGPDAGGETALGAVVTEDLFSIHQAGCDTAGPGDEFDLTYENHAEYVREE